MQYIREKYVTELIKKFYLMNQNVVLRIGV